MIRGDFMDKKHILIIIVIVAVLAAIGGYFLLNNQTATMSDHTTIVLSKSAYMEVPKNKNATSKADGKGVFYYKDKKEDINITSCSNISTDSGAKEMKKLKNDVATGSKKLVEDNVGIYEKNGTYSVFVKNTEYNDTLLIQSADKNLLLQCWKTLKYHDPTQKIDFGKDDSSGSGSVVSAVEKTESAVQSSAPKETSSSSSSSYSDSSSSWGYEWRSSGSGSSGSSGGSSKVGGSASSSDLFDYS